MLSKILKECFARLDENGEIELVNNEGVDSYVHGLIYITGEILNIDTESQTLEHIKKELIPMQTIINVIRDDLLSAIENTINNQVLQDNFDGIRMISRYIFDILSIKIIDEELQKLMINSKLKLIKSTLTKLLISIKLSNYDKSQFWSNKILHFIGEEI